MKYSVEGIRLLKSDEAVDSDGDLLNSNGVAGMDVT